MHRSRALWNALKSAPKRAEAGAAPETSSGPARSLRLPIYPHPALPPPCLHLTKGTLDYIFFSSDSLGVLAISEVDAESHLRQETALPSSTRPSDHLPLVAAFTLRAKPPPGSSTAPRPSFRIARTQRSS